MEKKKRCRAKPRTEYKERRVVIWGNSILRNMKRKVCTKCMGKGMEGCFPGTRMKYIMVNNQSGN